MMLLHKNKKLCFVLNSLISSSSHHQILSLFSFSTIKSQNPSQESHFIVDYLINTCGISLERAKKVSKHLTHIKSPSNPDSVIHFLKQSGFDDAQMRNLISLHPKILCANVDKTLKLKFTALRELGFSESELIRLVSTNHVALQAHDMRPKIDFWRSLLGNNDNLLKAFKRTNGLLTASLEMTIKPSISLFRECGIPDHDIAKMILSKRFITRNPESNKALIGWVEEMGINRHSGMFKHMLVSLSCISRTTFDAKVDLLKSLGWAEADTLSAFRKFPKLLTMSEKNIRGKMEFFVKEVGCELSYIACHPVLLGFSLERRVIPRCSVLRVLKRDELAGGDHALLSVLIYNEKKFVEKFIIPNKDKVPRLFEAYIDACTGNIPFSQSSLVTKEQ